MRALTWTFRKGSMLSASARVLSYPTHDLVLTSHRVEQPIEPDGILVRCHRQRHPFHAGLYGVRALIVRCCTKESGVRTTLRRNETRVI